MLLQETLDLPLVYPEEARARRTDPVTSHMAGDKSSATLSQIQSVVLSMFKAAGNLTDDELGIRYALLWSSQGWPQAHPDSPRKRRSELTARGLLVDSGERRTNTFGSAETVWVLATAENTAVTK